MRSALHPDRPGQCARGQPSKLTSFVPGLRGFGDDWPPGLCRPGLHPTIPWSDRGHCAQAHQGDAGKSRWQWNSPKRACLESVFWREIHAVEFGNRIELPFPSRTDEWFIYHSTVPRLESNSSVDITDDAVPEPNRF